MVIKEGYKQTEVGVIPDNWEVNSIKSVCKLVNGRGFKPFEWKTSGLPIVRIQNLNGSEEYNYYQGAYDKKIEIEKGQLLFAWSGSRGTSFGPHIWNGSLALLNYHTWKVVVNKDVIASDFFFHALNLLTKRIEDSAHGASALVHTQKWEMEGFKFAFPPTLTEQTAIATALSDTDELIQSLEKLITKKRLIKHGALQELLKPKENWVEKSLDELFAFSGGLTASREQLSDKGLAYLHYGDIHGSKKSYIDIEREYADIPKLDVPLNKVPSATLLGDGDLVFVDASEDDEGTSRHVVIKNPNAMPYIAGLHTIVAKSTNDLVDKNYRQYCFQSNDVKRQFKFYAVGTKVSGVSKSNIGKILLTLPPTNDEQRRIAASLSDMDAELAALEAKLDKYRHIKQGMMQELLTGRIRLV